MFKWLKEKFLKNKKQIKDKDEVCKNCVWWKSEEYCDKPFINENYRYCALNEVYTKNNATCQDFQIEKFKADESSTSTPELDLNLDLEIERDKLKGE